MPTASNSRSPTGSTSTRLSACLIALALALCSLASNAQTDRASVEFGDDASTWANDQECDDPRFFGTGMAANLLESDILHDASDCRALFLAESIDLKADNNPSPTNGVDFGDNISDLAFDAECGDPRFAGRGMSPSVADIDMFHDAEDCRALFEQGSIRMLPGYAVVLSGRLERGSLRAGDEARSDGSYSDTYTIIGDRGDSIEVDLRSGEFDTYLIVRPPRGDELVSDDYEGSVDRSQVTIPIALTGVYEVIVSSAERDETGAYTLWITKDK